jgi:hypothetical protein
MDTYHETGIAKESSVPFFFLLRTSLPHNPLFALRYVNLRRVSVSDYWGFRVQLC